MAKGISCTVVWHFLQKQIPRRRSSNYIRELLEQTSLILRLSPPQIFFLSFSSFSIRRQATKGGLKKPGLHLPFNRYSPFPVISSYHFLPNPYSLPLLIASVHSEINTRLHPSLYCQDVLRSDSALPPHLRLCGIGYCDLFRQNSFPYCAANGCCNCRGYSQHASSLSRER